MDTAFEKIKKFLEKPLEHDDFIDPVYFGYDEAGNLCDVVMEYIFVG